MNIGRFKSLNRTNLLTVESKNFLALLQMGILATQLLMLLGLLFLAARQNSLANRQPTMAQLVNGETVYLSEQDRNFRYPQVIRKVVSDWTTLTFNWEGTLAGTDQRDEGVLVKATKKKVPLNIWFASVMLEPKFAEASLKEIAELVPITVFTGRTRAVTIINYLSEPRQIAPSKWQVDLVATRMVIDRQSGASDRLPFNRTFTLQAVEIPRSPLGENAPLVERKIYDLRAAGLQITDITPYDPNSSQSGRSTNPPQ